MSIALVILLLAAGLFFLGLFFNVDKLQKYGAIVLWILMILVSSFRYDGSDVDVYQEQFYLSGTHGWDFWNEPVTKETVQPMFFFINKVFYECDYSFASLRFFVSLIPLLILLYIFHKYTKNWALVSIFYILYPFNVDLMQTRNFLMSTVLLISICVLANRDKIKRVQSLLITIISGGFHSLGLIYLPFVYFDKIISKWYIKLLFIVCLLSPIYVFFIINNAIEILSMLGLENTPFAFYLVYVQGATSDAGIAPYPHFIRTWLMTTLCTVSLIIINKDFGIFLSDNKKIAKWKVDFVYNVRTIWIYATLLLPFAGVTPSLDRISRSLLISFYIAMGIYFEYIDYRKKILFTLICLFIEIFYAGFFLNPNVISDYIFEVQSNYLFDLFN